VAEAGFQSWLVNLPHLLTFVYRYYLAEKIILILASQTQRELEKIGRLMLAAATHSHSSTFH